MKLATIRDGDRTKAVRIDGDEAVELDAADVGEVLRRDDWPAWAGAGDGARQTVADLDYAPLIVAPDKIVCCGLNYRTHILEFTRELPSYPTLFAKYRSTLTGADDDIELPTVTESREVVCEVDGVVKQKADTTDLLFGPEHLVSYISDIITLEPGDVIATGTPGGVGFARDPQEGLVDGSVMVTSIEGLGECRNIFKAAR